ncbi:hypothetical protein ACET3Z_010966 [Daucus carota]
MSSGRRRSSRLIANPELYNWPKKKPAFINLEEDGATGEEANIVGKKQRAEVIVSTPKGVSKTKRNLTSPIGKKVAGSNIETGSVEEEDEFVTPRENFGSSWKKAAQQHEGEGTRVRIRSCGKQGTSAKKSISHAKLSENHKTMRGKKIVAEARVRAYKRNVNNSPLGVRRTPCKETEWVKKAGFEHLLGFQMCSYPHRLGYKVVSAEQDGAV